MNVDVETYVPPATTMRMADGSANGLLHAACVGDVTALRSILEGGEYCDVDQVDKLGRSALHWAVVRGHAKAVETLVTVYHASLDLLTRDSESPLMLAVSANRLDLVQQLLSYGANPQQANSAGESALHLACAAGNVGMCEALVQHGAWLEWEDAEGESPLFYAIRETCLPVVQLLLAAGASPSHPNNDQETPLSLAHECLQLQGDSPSEQILQALSAHSSPTPARHNLFEPFTRVESRSFGSSSGNLGGFLTKTI